MKQVSLILFITFLLMQIYSCDSSVNSDTDGTTGASIAGSLDSSNVGIGEMVTLDNIDLVLNQIFTVYAPGNGIDIFYERNNRANDIQRDTLMGDTTISMDTTCNGKTGYTLCSGSGEIGYETIEDDETFKDRRTSKVHVTETFYNYSPDNVLYLGGEALSTKVEIDKVHESSLVSFWTNEKTETCSLYIAFNGRYEGSIQGVITDYIHENSDMVLDSSMTVDLTLQSGNTVIEIEKEQLEQYLRK